MRFFHALVGMNIDVLTSMFACGSTRRTSPLQPFCFPYKGSRLLLAYYWLALNTTQSHLFPFHHHSLSFFVEGQDLLSLEGSGF